MILHHPKTLIHKEKDRLTRNDMGLSQRLSKITCEKEYEHSRLLTKLEALSPLKVMARGYSLSYKADGTLIKSINQVNKDEKLKIKLMDGSLYCEVKRLEVKE